MGRPREHDEQTRVVLLDAAERMVANQGLAGMSLRALTNEVGTTTRAVYSIFGSKDGLIGALGARTFDLLALALEALPVTSDPAADLINAGVLSFRQLVLDHPALFQLGIQQTDTNTAQLAEMERAAARAWTVLQARVARLQLEGGLGAHSIDEAATAFHALCEGLAALEIRGAIPTKTAKYLWRSAITAIVHGFSHTLTSEPGAAVVPATPARQWRPTSTLRSRPNG